MPHKSHNGTLTRYPWGYFQCNCNGVANMLDQLNTSPNTAPDDGLYSVAQDLLDKANNARNNGDIDTFKRLIKAALDCLTDDNDVEKESTYKTDTSQIAKLRGILAEGWQEVDMLSQKMGVGTSRIHTLIAKMRRTGESIQALSFKKYRIPSTEN